MWKASLFAVILTGCGSSMDEMSEMGGALNDIRLETNRHIEASHAMPSMENMRMELTRHRYEMMPLMEDLDVTMNSMSTHCSGMTLADMHAMHGDLYAEWNRHMSSMGPEMTIPVALAEVDNYANAVRSMADAMDRAMTGMHCM